MTSCVKSCVKKKLYRHLYKLIKKESCVCLYIINFDITCIYKTCENHQVERILRSSASASLVKISAISRPTDVPFNPLRPRVRRPTASRASFSPPLYLSLSLSSLPSSPLFSLTLLRAMLCFAEDRICQIPERGGWRQKGSES